jgi:hypothetical protein
MGGHLPSASGMEVQASTLYSNKGETTSTIPLCSSSFLPSGLLLGHMDTLCGVWVRGCGEQVWSTLDRHKIFPQATQSGTYSIGLAAAIPQIPAGEEYTWSNFGRLPPIVCSGTLRDGAVASWEGQCDPTLSHRGVAPQT